MEYYSRRVRKSTNKKFLPNLYPLIMDLYKACRSHNQTASVYTVNSDIFARILFSQNFTGDVKFRENRTLTKRQIHSVY